MSKFIVCTRPQRGKLQKLVCWLMGIPARGVGLPENIDADPGDGRRDVKGWVTRYSDFYRYPGNTGASTDQFALELVQPIVDAWQARNDELHALIGDTKFSALQTWIENHMTSAADLAADWRNADGDLDNSEDVVPDASF